MRERERGFTLIEMIVTVAVCVVLLAAGGVWMFGWHPGALRGAADSFDASLAQARGIAASSGNGATIAFLPRTDPHGDALAGFAMTVYAGRPTTANAVVASNAMPLVSDASVAEKTLGKPPFAIFLSSAGHPSGQSAYPAVGAHGAVTFAAIPQQPVCPTGGLVLTFTGPQGATVTRTLPCNVSVAGVAAANPSPTPNAPLLTPSQLVFDWPSAPEQSVVATEWGYTHWFASTTGFTCGGITGYPSAPLPYTAAYLGAEADATPMPPVGRPYSYPNSNGESMNDAPATFPVLAQSAGACTLQIADDYGQVAGSLMHVMGALTAAPASVSWPLPTVHAEQDVVLSKVFDDDALRPSVTSSTCGGIANTRWAAQDSPTTWNDTATVTMGIMPQVMVSTGLNVGGACAITVASQYRGEPSQTITVNVATPNPVALDTWPEAIHFAQPGYSVTMLGRQQPFNVAAFVNKLFGGGVAQAAAPGTCTATAWSASGTEYTSASMIPTGTFPQAAGSIDANGCYNGNVYAVNPNGTSVPFDNDIPLGTCVKVGAWSPLNGISSTLPASAVTNPPGNNCTITISDGQLATASIDHGLVNVVLDSQPPNYVTVLFSGAVDSNTSTAWYSYDNGNTWTTTEYSNASADAIGFTPVCFTNPITGAPICSSAPDPTDQFWFYCNQQGEPSVGEKCAGWKPPTLPFTLYANWGWYGGYPNGIP